MKRTFWIVLLCMAGWALWLSVQSKDSVSAPIAWPEVKQDIVKIIIDNPDVSHIVLQWVDGQWTLGNGDLAVQDAALRLHDDLIAMRPVRLLTHKHRYDDELGFGAKAVQLRCLGKDDKELLSITIGKQGSDLLSTYVRRKGNDAIVAVNRSLIWQVKRSKSSWHDVEHKTP